MVLALKAYLSQSIDPYDFAYRLHDYFEEEYGGYPDWFDPDEPSVYLESPDFEAHREGFVKWMANNVGDDVYQSPYVPSYLLLSSPRVFLQRTWLIHFSDHARDICEEGFAFGQPDFSGLALTTHLTHEARTSQAGFNFAFFVEDRSVPVVARRKKYGRDAVMFMSAGVVAYHSGDDEWQAIFWGPSVRQAVLLEQGSEGWEVSDKRTGRVLFRNEDIRLVIRWVISHVSQYRRRILIDLPAHGEADR